MKNKRSMMESECDVKDIVVIDNGTDTIKVGISGEDYPRLIYDNCCGQPTLLNDNDNLANKPSLLFGQALKNTLNDKKFNVQLSQPIRDGKIENHEQMRDFWSHILEEGLQISELTQVNLLIIDQVKNTKEYKAKLSEILFDYLKVQSVLFMNSSTLSLFSTGNVSGLSIELGHAVNTIVPIYQGFPIMHALQYSHLSGQQITSYLAQDLKNSQINLEQYDQWELITKDIKERMCYVAEDYEQQLAGEDHFLEEERSYELPDSQVIQITPNIRYRCTESLFNPSLVGLNNLSLQDMIVDSITRCDNDLQQDLVNNMVLGGGTSMCQGLIPRLHDEITNIFPGGAMRSEFNFIADFQRKYSAWIGGSMMGSLNTFQSLAITRQEYEENPDTKDAVIKKKTF